MALNNRRVIITGPAGSGKTRTLRTLIYNLEMNGIKYMVTSFTGKAVIRAKELNGIGDMAATMHRLLFTKYGDKMGEVKYVIFDEATMIDNWLMWAFITYFIV